MRVAKVEQADGKGEGRRDRKWLKTRKHRAERRRANSEPETQPAYTKYRGWLT